MLHADMLSNFLLLLLTCCPPSISILTNIQEMDICLRSSSSSFLYIVWRLMEMHMLVNIVDNDQDQERDAQNLHRVGLLLLKHRLWFWICELIISRNGRFRIFGCVQLRLINRDTFKFIFVALWWRRGFKLIWLWFQRLRIQVGTHVHFRIFRCRIWDWSMR